MTQPATKRGHNRQPARQVYHSRPGRRIKRATEAIKQLYGLGRLTPEQRSGIALLVNPLTRDY